MRPAENIEKLIKNIKIDTNAKVDKAVLNDILETFKQSKTKKSAIPQPNIWRIVMKSRITKLATVAVIIIAVLIGIHQFGGSIDGATIAFADISEAMKNVQWIDRKSVV